MKNARFAAWLLVFALLMTIVPAFGSDYITYDYDCSYAGKRGETVHISCQLRLNYQWHLKVFLQHLLNHSLFYHPNILHPYIQKYLEFQELYQIHQL